MAKSKNEPDYFNLRGSFSRYSLLFNHNDLDEIEAEMAYRE